MFESIFTISLTFFLVIDALGNIPVYYSLIKKYDQKTQFKIAVRELLVALLLMLLFNFVGEYLITLLGISKATVQIGGGIILFLIALRLIFSNEEAAVKWDEHKLLIVPIATPIIASPSLLASIMIFAQEIPSSLTLVLSILFAWLVSSIIFLFAKPILKIVKEKGLMACQRLMGLIVAIIAVQMFLLGIGEVVRS